MKYTIRTIQYGMRMIINSYTVEPSTLFQKALQFTPPALCRTLIALNRKQFTSPENWIFTRSGSQEEKKIILWASIN